MISIRKSQPIPTGIIQVQSCKLDAIQEEDEEEGKRTKNRFTESNLHDP